MNNSYRHILNIFHSNNHTQVNRVCKLSPQFTYFVVKEIEFEPKVHYEYLTQGIYTTTIDNCSYLIHLPHTLTDGDYFCIRSKNNAYYIQNGHKYALPVYKFVEYRNNSSEEYSDSIDINTVNSALSGIMICASGYHNNPDTIISDAVAPDAINDFSKLEVKSLKLKSTNLDDTTQTDELTLDLKYRLRGFGTPETSDWVFINSEICVIHYILNIRQIIITGNEEWEEIDYYSGNGMNTFFMPVYDMKDTTDQPNKIWTKSNCLIDMPESSVIFPEYSIFQYKHNDQIGICVTMKSDDYDDDNVQQLRAVFREHLDTTPIRINYLLNAPKHQIDLIDEYHLKTFFKRTNITIEWQYPCAVSYFYKTLDNNPANLL